MAEQVVVIGAGSWGTTLANLLAKKGAPVRLWAYEDEVVEAVNTRHVNPLFLEDVPLDPRLTATGDLEEAVREATVVVAVTPSQHLRAVVGRAASALGDDVLVVSASKGIETRTLKTMAEVLDDILPPALAASASFLSGPSFAAEVAREEPTAVAVASRSPEAAERTQELFQTAYFRVYTNRDVIGVELGGALKNIMAIASGMVAGLGLGHNATAALITRGLAEMSRLGVALGANPLTFAGLAGMGDLILTCTGGLSRNRSVGVELGRGRSLEEILAEMKMVAEGVETTRAAFDLARRTGVEMPLVEEVHAVLFEGRDPKQALETLMLRDPKPERWQ